MKYIITEKTTLLEALVLLAPEASQSTRRQWLKNGRVYVDGSQSKLGNITLVPGQTVSLGDKPKKSFEGIQVLYEDKDILVINKPVGLLSVATNFETEKTVHGILKKHYNQRVYVVHRLDQETSGVMIFALSKDALLGLKEQFAAHTITRCYSALVEGTLRHKSGTWDTLLREDELYKVHVADDDGERAITHYQVVGESKNFSELDISLETGKKNQIRVHCNYAGHPVVGDRKYGSTINLIGRLALHARQLSFDHPILGKRMSFQVAVPWKIRPKPLK